MESFLDQSRVFGRVSVGNAINNLYLHSFECPHFCKNGDYTPRHPFAFRAKQICLELVHTRSVMPLISAGDRALDVERSSPPSFCPPSQTDRPVEGYNEGLMMIHQKLFKARQSSHHQNSLPSDFPFTFHFMLE